MAVLDIRILTGCLLGAVVHVTDGLEQELLSRIRAVCVGEVVAGVERSAELHVLLRQVLALRGDAVHVVIAHRKCVACALAVGSRVGAGGRGQTVEVVVGVGVCHLPACLAALRY